MKGSIYKKIFKSSMYVTFIKILTLIILNQLSYPN